MYIFLKQRWNAFLKMGLKKKTLLFVMGIFGIGMFISVVAFSSIYRNLWKKSVIQQIENISKGREESIQKYVSGLEDMAYNVSYSNWLQDIFQKNVTAIRMMERQENAEDFLCSLSTLYDGNQFAAIALRGTRVTGTHDYYLDYGKDITKADWYQKLLMEGKYVQIGEGEEKGIYRGHPEWDMTIYYRVNDYNTLETTGVMVITIPMKNLKSLLDNSYEEVCFVLQAADGTQICSDMPEKFQKKMSQNRDQIMREGQCLNLGDGYYALNHKISTDFFDWNLITLTDANQQKLNNLMLVVIFIGMLGMAGALLLVVSIVVSHYLTRPILTCKNAMLEIRNNRLGVTIPNGYQDEIGELIQGFNEMSSSLESLVEKNKMITALQKEAELKNLERQINPHFLFNTLEIINSLILGRKEKSAMLICETLGKLYRYNLRGSKWITLRDELEYTKQYLLIMKYKIDDLTVMEEVDENLLNLVFLKVILQPIVENSIKHGFLGRSMECCISILVERQNEKVHIELMDNGNGIEKESLLMLQKEIQDIRENPMQHLPESSHIGVKNVAQRLFLEYGEAAEIRIQASAGLGTKVELSVPILEKAEEM